MYNARYRLDNFNVYTLFYPHATLHETFQNALHSVISLTLHFIEAPSNFYRRKRGFVLSIDNWSMSK